MLMKKYPREKVPSGNRKRYSNKRSVQQLHKGQSTSPPTPRRNEDVDDEISTTMKGNMVVTLFKAICMHTFSNN